MWHTIKIKVSIALKIIGIHILTKENFSIYKSIYNCSEKGIEIPLSTFTIVSKEVYLDYKNIYQEPFVLANLPKSNELPVTSILDWNPNKDSLRIKESAQDYRAEISSSQYAKTYRNKLLGRIAINNGRGFWRLETMRQLRKEEPEIFKGKVLEVGAGTGFISSSLSKFDEIESIYTLDYDKYTVENLMPLVHWSLDAKTNKITRVIGSYNKMEVEDDCFDTVIAVGAMHHSEDIRATFGECYRVLKPGGKFIVSDYVVDNKFSQEEFCGMMDIPLNKGDAKGLKDGLKIKSIKTNRTISEHARPSHSYLSAAFDAGFNINAHFFDATTQTNGYLGLVYRYTKALIFTLKNKNFLIPEEKERVFGYDVFGNVKSFSLSAFVKYPFYAKNTPSLFSILLKGQNTTGRVIYDNMVLILEKPKASSELKFKYKFRNGEIYHFPVKLPMFNK